MSIFSRIKDAIFGSAPKAAPVPSPPTASGTKNSPGTTPASAAGIPASPANAAWDRPVDVDVEAILTELAARNPQKLNWNSSIVDLMKLLSIDSSLENRKELATELGFTGDKSDSAAMNIWLHKRVMQELEKNGGKVPKSLTA